MCEIVNYLQQFPRTENGPITHTIIGQGSYNLSPNDTIKLYKMINRAKNKGKPVPSVLERIQKTSILMFDLDFKYKDDLSERQFDENFIKKLYSYLTDKITDVFSIADESQLQMWVMQKDNILPAPQKGYKSKDGLHLQFPNIISNTKCYHDIIDLIYSSADEFNNIVSEHCKTAPSNDIKAIFDTSPYKNGNWYIPGCGKNGEPSVYSLTNIYQYENDDIKGVDIEQYLDNPLEIMKKNSMVLNKDINIEYIGKNNNNISNNAILKGNNTNSNVRMELYEFENIDNKNRIADNDRKFLKGLIKLLSSKRSDDYNEWINIGYYIHSLSRTKFGYDLWIEFSKKSNKFDKNICDKQWKYMDRTAKDNTTIGSLIHCVNNDDPMGYQKLRYDSLDEFVRKTVMKEKTCGAHADVANLVGKFYRNDFICACLKDSTWYYFSPELGKWKQTEKGHELRKRLSTDIVELYLHYAAKYKELRGDDADSEEYEKYEKYNTNCHKIIVKLKDCSYKDKIMTECKEIFYDEDFLSNVNTKLNLIAMKNCVIDLRAGTEDNPTIVFREGLPDDYITISTKYDIPIDKKDFPLDMDKALVKILNRLGDDERQKMIELDDFINKILPIEDVREYTMRFLSSCLSGEVPVHKFNIWTGSGGNGKSMLVKLMNNTLGDYAKTMDVSYITKERGGSSAASPEIELVKYARFVPMSEPERQDSIFAGKLKHITGGDTMTSRGLFKETSEFKPQFKMMLMCNDLPSIPSVDGGVRRRLEVVDFVSRFVDNPHPTKNDPYQFQKDSSLENKLEEWNIVFLFKLLEYYPKFLKFIEEGHSAPESVTKATDIYLTENDLVQKWIKEDITPSNETYSLTSLEQAFKTWCENEGSNPKNIQKKELKKALEDLQRKSSDGLIYGEKASDNAPNGTSRYPKFNFCSKEDLD